MPKEELGDNISIENNGSGFSLLNEYGDETAISVEVAENLVNYLTEQLESAYA